MPGRVLTIHLVEGTANGLQTAEIDGWIGKVFLAPKTDLPTMLKQQEIKDSLGVYVLVGDDPDHFGRNIIYVGQGSIANRLTTHSNDVEKDYWDSKTLAVVAKDGSLNTADCLYLESRLIELARKSSSAHVKNLTNPAPPFLTPTDKTKVENFLTQIQTLLPVLNVNFFTPTPVSPSSSAKPIIQTAASQSVLAAHTQDVMASQPPAKVSSPRFVFATSTASAEAELINNSFVVLKGSTANPVTASSIMGKSSGDLRSELLAAGKLNNHLQDGKWIFTEDVAFSSPSAAAAVVCGSSTSGPQVWKVKDTLQTYREWQQAQVAAVSSDDITS